jgi:hypothetical protein
LLPAITQIVTNVPIPATCFRDTITCHWFIVKRYLRYIII